MCEIFGYCARQGKSVNEYLKEFYSHSKKHPHGWGLACLNGNQVSIEKEPMQATRSNYLRERLSQKIIANHILSHIRYATIGNVEYGNCHPYTKKDNSGRQWTLIHNGTIFDFQPLYKYTKIQEGQTDSERILLYLVDKMNESETAQGKKLSGKERFQVLDCIINNMARDNKLNLLFSDGEYMYVHTNYQNSLYCLEKENEIFFATSPLSEEEWKHVPFTTLLAYKQGKIAFQGSNHKREYIDNEENMKMLYQIFAEL